MSDHLPVSMSLVLGGTVGVEENHIENVGIKIRPLFENIIVRKYKREGDAKYLQYRRCSFKTGF